jgi:glycosyltransferase involved in cell wall biosynthesis
LSRIAFVIPWFGRTLLGGAEQHVFQVTTRLARRGHRVEVLATCNRSFQDDWQTNHFREGVSEESGVLVRRFAVRPRNVGAFDLANAELVALNDSPKRIGVSPVADATARGFVEENIHAPGLVEFVEREARGYAAVVFAPYLYGPTLLGLEHAGDRAVLQPLLHDETYAYLPAVDTAFRSAKRILFISEGEAMLAARLYGPSMWRKGIVTGGGVEAPPSPRGDQGAVAGLDPGSYLLYLGRRDRAKNVDLLVRAYQEYRGRRGGRLRLVLGGPGSLESPGEGIADLGVLSDDRKAWLLSHCRALVQPSRNESYSRTMMEAWLREKPVIVNAECLATSLAMQACGGGWLASTEPDWAAAFGDVERASHGELVERGRRGRRHAEEHADWEKAIDRYEQALDLPRSLRQVRPRPRRHARAIHQLLPNLSFGDAISNQAVLVCELLRDLGYRSNIFVRHFDEPMEDFATLFDDSAIASRDALLYHHSVGSDLTAVAVHHPGPKALLYHNITPAHFFEPWDQPFAELLASGRKELSTLAHAFPLSAGASQYNAAELRDVGFRDSRVVPIVIEPSRWAARADPRWMRDLQDGRTNILFVGRVAPNKCQHDLLEAFAEYLHFDANARLVIAGYWPEGDRYVAFLQARARRLGIDSRVVWTGMCTEAQLQACYRTAHLFVSMSEHEGFCAPLVEAMWFDVPVLAYRSTAVPETLSNAGLLFTEKRFTELGALMRLAVEDASLRRTILAAQRARRSVFLPEAVLPGLIEFLEELSGAAPSARAGS